MPEITFGNQTINYRVRHSKRARRINLKIDPTEGLEIVLPEGFSADKVEPILRERRHWIVKNLERHSVPERTFETGEILPFMGEDHQLEITTTKSAKRTTIGRQGGWLRVRVREGLHPHDQREEVRKALEKWYRKQAKSYIPERTAELAARYGFADELQKVTIKGQKTRWGSCSSNGNLNFNWRLMMTPPEAIDYVIVHELCHLREMNHSARFWAWVAEFCPNYRYWRDWLKANNTRLYL